MRLGWPSLTVLLGLGAVGALLRITGLGPSSLWLDDAWVALSWRADTADELLMVGVTAPGFVLLERTVFAAVGFSAVAAQAIPFVAGVLGGPVVFLTARRLELSLPASALAAVAVTLSPVHIDYSVRVKQFTIDVLMVAAIVWLAWRVVERPHRGVRWAALVAVATIGTIVSAGTVAMVFGGFVAATYAARRRGSPMRMPLGATASYGAIAFMWWLLVLRPNVNDALRTFWDFAYISGPQDAWRALHDLTAGFVSGWPVVAVLVLAASAARLVRHRRALALMLLTPLGVAVALAAARQVPLGTGRTDMYLYPLLALLWGCGADAFREGGWGGRVAIGALALVLVVPVPSPASYPQEDVRPLVHHVERRLESGDVVLVSLNGGFAYALYTRYPVDLRRTPAFGTGFEPQVRSRAVHILDPPSPGEDGFVRQVAPLTRDARRVWLVIAHAGPDETGALRRAMDEAGFVHVSEARRPGASAQLWSRT